MHVVDPKHLNEQTRERLAELHKNPNPPAAGVHLFHAMAAVKCTDSAGIGCWLFVGDYACNAIRRLAVAWRDVETMCRVEAILNTWDLIEVTATETKGGNIKCKIRLVEKCSKETLVPQTLLSAWCAPLTRRGKLGWPLIRQTGTGHRLMVAGWTPHNGLDAADFTQAYNGVSGLPEFARRLLELGELNTFLAVAARDGRPAERDFLAFQEFIAAIGPTYSTPTPLPDVLYTWLHRHPGIESALPSYEGEQDADRKRVFREIFCRFKPDLVLICGARATNETAAILETLGSKTRVQLAKLRQRGLIRRQDFWNRAIFAGFGPGVFSGKTAFVPIFDLNYFGQAKVGSNPVPPDYWSKLAEFIGHWIDDSLPSSIEETDDWEKEVLV